MGKYTDRCYLFKNGFYVFRNELNCLIAPQLRCKVVAWHPEVATQLCLASEDDHSPLIQLWDLRFATSPLKTLDHHQRSLFYGSKNLIGWLFLYLLEFLIDNVEISDFVWL